MSDFITASFGELLSQATDTAAQYMCHAKRNIDELFGEGYAAANPTLVAAFMQTAAADFGAASNGKVIGSALLELASSIDEVAQVLRES